MLLRWGTSSLPSRLEAVSGREDGTTVYSDKLLACSLSAYEAGHCPLVIIQSALHVNCLALARRCIIPFDRRRKVLSAAETLQTAHVRVAI